MIDSGKINSRQLIFLLTLLTVSTELLFLPGLIVREAAEGAWLSIALANAFAVVTVMVVAALGARYPGKSIVEYSAIILGTTWGKIAGFLFVSYTFLVTSIVLREFYELVETSFMPETPPTVFAVSFILVAALAVRLGIEVIARNGELFFMLSFFIIAFLLILLTKDVQLSQLQPILGDGLGPIIRGTIPAAGFTGEIFLLAFLIPCLNRPKEAKRSGLLATLIMGSTMIIITEFTIGVFGADLTANTLYPALSMGRFISIANFLEHLDAFFLIFWIIAVFIKLALIFYIAVIATAQLTGLKEYKALVLPAAVIINNFSFVTFDNTVELLVWLGEVWPPYALTIEFFIPLILLLFVIVGRRKKKAGGN